MDGESSQSGFDNGEEEDVSQIDKDLRELFKRMVPTLKRGILWDAERKPDVMILQIVLLASVLRIRRELGCP